MKTKIYLSTVLAFIIQVMVPGQTPDNQSARNTDLKSTKKILIKLDGKANKESANTFITNNNVAVQKKETVKSTFENVTFVDENNVTELQKQAEEISLIVQKMREEAKTRMAEQKKKLLADASQLEIAAMVTQIQASEISGRISQQKFNSNKQTITVMVTSLNGETNIPGYTKNLIYDSERSMKLAKELRQEAYAEPSLASKLGTMSNAEEKETIALGKQTEAIGLLEKTPKSHVSMR